MAFFTDWATKLTAFLTQNVGATAIILTKADGSPDMAQSDGSGGLVMSQSPATFVGSSALEKSHVASATPCNLRSAKALNTSASTVYMMVFDSATLPANGTAPSRIPIPIASGDVNGDVWQGGTIMSTGCVVALSSTLSTLTLVATSCGWFDCEVS